jgi:hypothetical protein
MRQQTSPTKAYGSSSLAAAASLTELSLNHQVSTVTNVMLPNGIANNSPSENISSNLLKSPIATNNNIYNNVIETQGIADAENGADGTDKFTKRLKLL